MLVEPEHFVLEEAPIPGPAPDEVIIKVERCGICGSDVHIYHGVSPIKPPVVLGHEFSGTIYLKGSAVEGFQIGDRVTAEPGIQCGKCTYCQSGRYNLCINQYTIGARLGHDGAYADYVRVPAGKIIPLPEGMSFEVGAMVEPVACAMHALDVANINSGDAALVIGTGTIGLLIAQAVRMAGADIVVVADLVPQRLALARELGADAAVDVRKIDLVAWAKETYGEGGITHVLDTASVPQTFQQALQIVRRGGRIVNIGVPIKPVEWNPIHLLWEIEITGMNMYTRGNFDEALDAITKGLIQVEPLISASYSLARIEDAYDVVLHDPKRIKVMLTP